MTSADRVNQLSGDEFMAMWNGSDNLDEVVEKVVERVGKVPRWAVLVKATALRKAGNSMKSFAPAREAG